MIFCRVLGSTDVEVNGRTVEFNGRMARRLVAALCTTTAPVPDEQLAEMVWGQRGPSDVTRALRVLVHRVRQMLGPAAADAVQRTDRGYLLAVPLSQTDHGQLAELVDAGMEELGRGAAHRAAASLEAALALWRGQPWADLGDAVAVSALRNKLRELRDNAVEELQAARLAYGDTARAIAALSEAVTESPYRERRWELLALGLYRSGRQSQALAELRRVRQLLVDELGVEPGAALRSLEQRMLDQDPSLLVAQSPMPAVGAQTEPEDPVHSLPRPNTTLVGRERELADITELLQHHRMVTIVGHAGVGKTRLAIEHAASDPDAWLVRLADVGSADALAPTIAAAIGLTYVAWDPILAIRRAISDRPGLLILDNCEHLSEDIAAITATLLTACPRLRVLATSRRVINVEAEHVISLEPLTVDADGGGPAVALLCDRVRMNRPNWQPTASDRGAAREICVALDGLPLAIELAAARERAFGLGEIAVHLRQRLDILGNTPRGSLSAHRSLQAAISWSVDQLAPADQRLLLRLWPFEGGFTWQAVEAVHPVSTAAPVLATLAALVDRSVLVVDLSSGRPRYRMLETLRRYCESVDTDPFASREAHAAWVRGFCADQARLLATRDSAEAFRAFEAELANIRAGIVYDLAYHPIEALRTTGGLFLMWVTIGAIHDGIRLIRASLDACPDAPVEDRARGLVALSMASFHAGNSEAALDLADEAITLLQDCADAHEALFLEALSRKCNALADLEKPEQLREAAERFKAEADSRATPRYLQACALFGIAVCALRDGDVMRARDTLLESRTISERCGFLWGQGISEVLLAWGIMRRPHRNRSAKLQVLHGLARAVSAFERQPNVSEALGALYAGAFALADLGEIAVAARLRAGVFEHASRVGTDPCRYAPPDIDSRLTRLLASEHLDGEAPMNRPAMVTLFTETVAALS